MFVFFGVPFFPFSNTQNGLWGSLVKGTDTCDGWLRIVQEKAVEDDTGEKKEKKDKGEKKEKKDKGEKKEKKDKSEKKDKA